MDRPKDKKGNKQTNNETERDMTNWQCGNW